MSSSEDESSTSCRSDFLHKYSSSEEESDIEGNKLTAKQELLGLVEEMSSLTLRLKEIKWVQVIKDIKNREELKKLRIG